jgi:hypothetical protein
MRVGAVARTTGQTAFRVAMLLAEEIIDVIGSVIEEWR